MLRRLPQHLARHFATSVGIMPPHRNFVRHVVYTVRYTRQRHTLTMLSLLQKTLRRDSLFSAMNPAIELSKLPFTATTHSATQVS